MMAELCNYSCNLNIYYHVQGRGCQPLLSPLLFSLMSREGDFWSGRRSQMVWEPRLWVCWMPVAVGPWVCQLWTTASLSVLRGGNHCSSFGLQKSLTFKTQRKECPEWGEKKSVRTMEIDLGISVRFCFSLQRLLCSPRPCFPTLYMKYRCALQDRNKWGLRSYCPLLVSTLWFLV